MQRNAHNFRKLLAFGGFRHEFLSRYVCVFISKNYNNYGEKWSENCGEKWGENCCEKCVKNEGKMCEKWTGIFISNYQYKVVI